MKHGLWHHGSSLAYTWEPSALSPPSATWSFTLYVWFPTFNGNQRSSFYKVSWCTTCTPRELWHLLYNMKLPTCNIQNELHKSGKVMLYTQYRLPTWHNYVPLTCTHSHESNRNVIFLKHSFANYLLFIHYAHVALLLYYNRHTHTKPQTNTNIHPAFPGKVTTRTLGLRYT